MTKTKVCICNECGVVFAKDYIGEPCYKNSCYGEIVEYSEELEETLKNQ